MSDNTRKAYGSKLKEYAKSYESAGKNAKKAGLDIDGFNKSLIESGESGIKTTTFLDDITSGLEGFGKTALSIGGNVLLDLGVSFALQKAGEAWDAYSNQQENAIQKGNDALNDYKQTNQEMQSATSWVKENGERFTELSQKATQLGEQGKLTNSEFQEYNQLSAQAAEYFPKLVTGYNSENTPITSLGKSVNSLDDALSTEKLNRYAEAASSAKDVISKFKAEMYQDSGITKETGITNKQKAIEDFLKDYSNGTVERAYKNSNSTSTGGYGSAYSNLYAKNRKNISDYIENGNLTDAFESAGIKGSGWFGGYTKDDFVNPDNIQTLRNYYEDLQSQAENSVSAIKEVMPAFFQEQQDYQKLIGKNSNLDTEIGTMLTGLTQDSIERIIGGSIEDMSDDEVVAGIRNWSKKLVNNLQDQDTQDAFENLFSVNDNKDSLSFQDYEKKASNAVDAVAKKTSAFTKDELKQQSGITDSLDEMQTAYNNIADRFGKDKGFSEDYVKNQLSASDMLTLGTMATDDQYKDLSYNDALEKITVAKRQNELSVANLQKSVDTITSQYSTVSSAIEESMSDTGLTQDSITAIKNSVKDVIDSSEELKDFDLDGLFTNTSKGVKLNNSQLENLLDIQNDIKEQDFAESIDQQTEALEKQTKEAENLKKQYGETSDEYVNALEKQKQAQEDLNATQQAQSQYYAQYQQQKQLFSDYADWQRATQTENSGDKYLSMVSGLETAKKAFDAGEVGTDDFKAFAKMISPSGSTDAANFAENYGKAARYLTEDESGLLNFFQDLSTKTDAAGEKMAKFNEETQSWELNVHDLGEIAQTLGTGTPLVEALFGRAEDYGATSTVISDMQDGILKSTEATKNWAEAKARLDRMNEENAQAQQEGKDPIYNTTAIQAAEDEVAKYQQQIDGLQESMDYYAEHNLGSEAQQKKIKTAADEISNIQQKMQEAEKNNNETLANAYRNLAKEKAAAAGITVDDDLNVTGNGKTAQEQLQEKSSSGSSSLSGTDFNYDKTSMTLDEIDSKINELQGKRATIDVDVEGEETVNALDTEISALEAQKIQVQIQTAVENGNSLQELLTLSDQELMTTVGCDASQVDAVRAEIQEMSGESVDLTVAMDSTQFVALINAITGETVEVPVEANTDGAVQETTSAIEGSNPKVTPEVDTSNVESQTQSAVQSAAQGATVELPSVDVKGNITSVEPYSGEVDVNAKANITGVVGGDNLNVVVNAKAHVTGSDGQTSEGTINYKKGNVEKADGTTSEGIINYKKGDVEKADGTVSTGIINYDLGNVATPTGMVATGVINYTLGSVAKPKAAGTFGQARAYAQGSLTDLSAYAGGRVALPKDEKALVNEVGTESIVRDGQWSLIPGGAHLENLKKGDIIFSASQTEDLLKRGATPGHARAYAQGSLSDLSPLSNAYANPVGGLSLKFGGGLSNKTSVSNGSGSQSENTQSTAKNTSATNANTEAKDENTKSSKDSTETFDWVKTKLDKFAKAVEYISNQITDYISSTLKISLLKKQMKAIDKEITVNQQGYDAYMKKANSIDISQSYKNKVMNGTFSIEEIDTSSDSGKQLAKDIKSFQEFYNSAQDCKDKVQELKNTLLETYETLANMPIEKAIDKLKRKYESLSNASETISKGGSTIAALQNQINKDNPKLATAKENVTKAKTARKKTKTAKVMSERALNTAKSETSDSGSALLKASKKQTSSIAKNLKSAAKSGTDRSTYNLISQAIRNGKSVSTKGLKGKALKYAKTYNASLKQQGHISDKVSSNSVVKTTKMSDTLKKLAKEYNADAKDQASAQKQYNKAKKADANALKNLSKANATKDSVYRQTTAEQQVLATNKDTKSYVVQNKLLDEELANLKKQNKERQKASKEATIAVDKVKKKSVSADKTRNRYGNTLLNSKSISKHLSKTQKAAIKAGKTVSTKGITNPDILKKLNEYNKRVSTASDLNTKLNIRLEAQADAAKEAALAEQEYAQALVDNERQKLENISTYYDSHMSQYENRNSLLNTYMDRMQTQGYNLSTGFYTAQIDQYQKQVDEKQAELAEMRKQFQESVDKGIIKEGTEEYYEMQDSIDQVAMSVEEATNNIAEMQASIRDLEWDQFDQMQDAISRITSESDFLIDLMSHKDMYDEDGKITDQGMATMGLHGVNYNTYMAQADKYKEEILKISEELANDPNNQKLIDRKNELIDAQQQSILSAENEKDSIKDLIQDGIDKELDALDDLIDKYLDALDKEKALWEYKKKTAEQSEKIASLQKQLSSLVGDSSEENKAKLQKLKEDLKSAQDDLEETQYDKFISDQKDLLNQLKDDYKKALDDRMDNIDALLSDAIASINSNSSSISQTLQTESKNVGYQMSSDMQKIWDTSEAPVITEYGDKFDSKLTTTNSTLDNIWKRQQSMIDAINAMANTYIQKVEENLKQTGKTETSDDGKNNNSSNSDYDFSDGSNVDFSDGSNTNSGQQGQQPTEPAKPQKPVKPTKTGNNKAEVGDKVTFSSGKYYGDASGGSGSGNSYLGKKVYITRINKSSKYPYHISTGSKLGSGDLGWVKLSQLKGYASGIMKVPDDQLAWTQEQGDEAIIRNDGGILTPLSRDMSVLNADMTKNLWDFMSNPGSFISDFSDSERYGVKNEDNSSSIEIGDINIECNMPEGIDSKAFVRELVNNKDAERAIRAMTIDRIRGKSSLAKYKYRN
nr:hypothetical protein [uncultured Lachnoclostridium sp.]